jgi:c-di-GMP-binding flagellar brake protein YcgR
MDLPRREGCPVSDERRREVRIRSVNLINYSRIRKPEDPDEPRAYELLGLARTIDLSGGGCRLLTSAPLPVGIELRLQLQLGEHIIDLEGEVARAFKSEGEWCLGVEFHALDDMAQAGIRAYLQFKENAEEA